MKHLALLIMMSFCITLLLVIMGCCNNGDSVYEIQNEWLYHQVIPEVKPEVSVHKISHRITRMIDCEFKTITYIHDSNNSQSSTPSNDTLAFEKYCGRR